MTGGKGTGGEMWLRTACLVASVGLHAGLGIIGWQGGGTAPQPTAPLIVSLAGSPGSALTSLRASSAQPIAPPRPGAVASGAAPRSAQPLEPVTALPPVVAEPELLQCVLPETAVMGAAPADAMPALAAGNGAGGEDESAAPVAGFPGSGSIAGNAGGAGAIPGDAAGSLTLAKPRYASNPKPEYPRLARQNRWEGVVYLRAAISDAGEVESVTVENSSGHPVLDHSAVGGVSRWRFVPARRGELEVPCEVRIPVAFRLDR